MTGNRRKLIEAIMMSDTGDERSYDEIYGDEVDSSIADAAADTSLSAEDIETLKSLAHQILQILGDEDDADDTVLAGDDTDDGAVLDDSASDDDAE